jgi:hypothetical protein
MEQFFLEKLIVAQPVKKITPFIDLMVHCCVQHGPPVHYSPEHLENINENLKKKKSKLLID